MLNICRYKFFPQVLFQWFLSGINKHLYLGFHSVQTNTDNFIQWFSEPH